jgi:hypothetical protein
MPAKANRETCPHCRGRNSGEGNWKEAPLTRKEAARALGISVETLFNLRKAYGRSHEIEVVHRRNVLFYREHIETLKELLKWEASPITTTYPPGHPSGKTARIATISGSKAYATGAPRASAVKRRLR